jgi:uncharacterized RDD family membrane protein YckC
VSFGQAGRFIGFVVALLYFGLLNSRFGGGQTLGKRLFDIRVVDRDGQTLSPVRSILRFTVIAVPYFLNGLSFDVDPASAGPLDYLLGGVLIFVIFGGLGAIIYLFVFNRRTRQSLHDLVVGSFVVRATPVAAVIDFSTPRFHLIIVVALVLILPSVGIWVIQKSNLIEPLKPLTELQSTLESQLHIRQVSVVMGRTTTATLGGRASTTSYLEVNAQANEAQEDLNALLSLIAGIVLRLHPDLLGNQILAVQAQRSFDLGIAGWSQSSREAHDPAGWREKLR